MCPICRERTLTNDIYLINHDNHYNKLKHEIYGKSFLTNQRLSSLYVFATSPVYLACSISWGVRTLIQVTVTRKVTCSLVVNCYNISKNPTYLYVNLGPICHYHFFYMNMHVILADVHLSHMFSHKAWSNNHIHIFEQVWSLEKFWSITSKLWGNTTFISDHLHAFLRRVDPLTVFPMHDGPTCSFSCT